MSEYTEQKIRPAVPRKSVVQKKTWRIIPMAEGNVDGDRALIVGGEAHIRCRRRV